MTKLTFNLGLVINGTTRYGQNETSDKIRPFSVDVQSWSGTPSTRSFPEGGPQCGSRV